MLVALKEIRSRHNGNDESQMTDKLSLRVTALYNKRPAGWKQEDSSDKVREFAHQTCYYNRTWPFVGSLGTHPAAGLHNMRIGNSADKLRIVPKCQADQQTKHNMGVSAGQSKQQQHRFMKQRHCWYQKIFKKFGRKAFKEPDWMWLDVTNQLEAEQLRNDEPVIMKHEWSS